MVWDAAKRFINLFAEGGSKTSEIKIFSVTFLYRTKSSFAMNLYKKLFQIWVQVYQIDISKKYNQI